ncbi:hypothetical protein [Peribacillus kribbensis]|uniref:hypothetical protein n=1 Tax=Peribacillus kribbensis TaxID=356658 RepID=UPI0004281368|nr:hypothetical protein [Peribacillus kribbensis]
MVLFGPVMVNLLAFKINVMDRGASLSMGPNQYLDTLMSNKQNQGFGEENGDFCFVNTPLIMLNDSDLNDSNSVKTSVI